MITRFMMTLIVILVLAGCSSSKYVSASATRSRGDTVSIAQFNRRVSRGDIIVHRVKGGDIFTGTFKCAGDTCNCFDGYSAVLTRIPISDVQSVEYRNFTAGRILGVCAGILGGTIVGGLVAWASVGFARDAGFGIAEVGALGGLAGGIAGYIIGDRNGIYTEYRFVSGYTSRLTGMQPSGSKQPAGASGDSSSVPDRLSARRAE